MSVLTPAHRGHVENVMERPLTDEDVRPAGSFDALSDAQIELAALLRSRNYIAPMYYLQAVVPTASRADAKEFMERVAAVHIARQPPPELRDRAIFEHHAGRPLTNAESWPIATIYDMSEAQIDLTWLLARKEVSIAFLYLSRIAPDETIENCHEYAKHLATLETLVQPR